MLQLARRLEKHIADQLPVWAGADFAPLEAGIIDEDTYVQQGRDLEAAYGNAVLTYVLGTLQPDTDLALVGYPFTDEVSHQFMALVTPTDIDGNPNPCYDITPRFDDVTCTGAGTAGRVAIRSSPATCSLPASNGVAMTPRSTTSGSASTSGTSPTRPGRRSSASWASPQGEGGVHELDLFQRGGHVYALLATPFSEWFDPHPGGDFRTSM